jgi:N-methylhydantoinase A/oxoprolinase/acetone carboxylase beta subunit
LEIATVIVPEHAGVLSALGMLLADVRKDYSQTILKASNTLTLADLEQHLAPMVAQAKVDLAHEGFDESGMVIECSLDMRYKGQAYEINLPLSPSFIEDFHAQHQRLYGHANPSRITEVVNVRVNAAGITQKHSFGSAECVSAPLPAPVSTRQAWFGGRLWETAVYHRELLRAGMEGDGPAILSGGESTVVITPGFRFRIDGVGTLVATRKGGEQ